MGPQRLVRNNCLLLVMDVQERLVAAMAETRGARTIHNISFLIDVARTFNIPVIITEQYPKGLGPTVRPVLEALAAFDDTPVILEKLDFDAHADPAIAAAIHRAAEIRLTSSSSMPPPESALTEGPPRYRNTVILVGLEAHICVLQTAKSLVAQNFRVEVPIDATCSRRDEHWELSQRLLTAAGAELTCAESLAFELLGSANDPSFRGISRWVRDL